ncbi:MAG: AEC family transporter [Butyrivibrio sp.]|nr:AEC family transporter [Butyrivibrio sp.]
MENFIFSINATLPIFILMVLGYIFRKIGFLNEEFTASLNKFVFKIALPVLVFEDLATQDFKSAWDGKFVGFCFVVTLVSITVISLISKVIVKDKGERGEFIQGAFRSSAALLGLAFIHSIYGDGNTQMAPLMILGSVPLYNIFAVIILTVTADSEGQKVDLKDLIIGSLKGIVKNPILIGIFIGLVFSLLKIPQGKIFTTVVSDLGALATPLGLMAMGASFNPKSSKKVLLPAAIASIIKLFVLVAVFIPIAVKLGFRDQQIVALLVMLGSATTVSCFIMARNMNHDGVMSATIIMLTTVGCSFSLTFWLFVFKMMGII